MGSRVFRERNQNTWKPVITSRHPWAEKDLRLGFWLSPYEYKVAVEEQKYEELWPGNVSTEAFSFKENFLKSEDTPILGHKSID
ncbi:hypothetical protein AVEN_82014-1 [Araneus ventricosus]|uniref:Uncharacterized protein n=1 Tax=Araneus ventricosus TaxID=182803 RepID=A0A4Y2U5U6_ARAVE|nr:hypothetical protein AVEN_82014-1 [Araneus ventricosus]